MKLVFMTFRLELFTASFFLVLLTPFSHCVFEKIHLGDSGSLQTHNGPLSALPQTHANLSHVKINDDSMFSDVKAVARMGHFLSSSNGKSSKSTRVILILPKPSF